MRAGLVLRLPLLVLLAGCHSISIETTHDPDVDFKTLHTFGWLSVPPQATTAVDDQSLQDLVRAELESKGLQQRQDSPDLLVALHRTVEGSLNTKGWGYEQSGGRMTYYTLQEGELVIDLVDAKSRKNVWRGTASGAFKSDEMRAVRQERLAGLLHDMFAGFPPAR